MRPGCFRWTLQSKYGSGKNAANKTASAVLRFRYLRISGKNSRKRHFREFFKEKNQIVCKGKLQSADLHTGSCHSPLPFGYTGLPSGQNLLRKNIFRDVDGRANSSCRTFFKTVRLPNQGDFRSLWFSESRTFQPGFPFGDRKDPGDIPEFGQSCFPVIYPVMGTIFQVKLKISFKKLEITWIVVILWLFVNDY